VILGQDPYHGPGQAHGLSFSVQDGVKLPPSLKNIHKELKLEYPDFEIPASGNLTHWAEQGVLLLNSILTVEASKPASHSKIGWEKFTDSIISHLSDKREGIIFLLWGNFARSKKTLIDPSRHHILEAPHPSPFSAHS
jgi:uracil-DNA glycosylase